MASHTLIGYPIVQRLGLGGNEAIGVTIGATVLTDVSSLMVLAICVPIHTSGFSPVSLTIADHRAGNLTLAPVVVFGLSTVGTWLFRRKGYANEYQVAFMLLVITLAGLGAGSINLEAIIGAFLGRIGRQSRDQKEPGET